LLVLQVTMQQIDWWCRPALLEVERRGNRRQNQRRVGQPREAYIPYPVGEGIQDFGRDLQAQSRLAPTASAGQCHQPHIPPAQQCAHCCNLVLATDDSTRLYRQVVWAGVQGIERREVGGKIYEHRLEDVLSQLQILEAMGTQIA